MSDRLDRDHFRQLLEAQRDRFRRMSTEYDRDQRLGTPDHEVEDTSNLSSDNAYADAATDLYQQELSQTFEQRFKDRLMRTEDALERLNRGDFGRCLRCGIDIPEARLEAFPETPFCVDCASQVDFAA